MKHLKRSNESNDISKDKNNKYCKYLMDCLSKSGVNKDNFYYKELEKFLSTGTWGNSESDGEDLRNESTKLESVKIWLTFKSDDVRWATRNKIPIQTYEDYFKVNESPFFGSDWGNDTDDVGPLSHWKDDDNDDNSGIFSHWKDEEEVESQLPNNLYDVGENVQLKVNIDRDPDDNSVCDGNEPPKSLSDVPI
jgi:hypothetical protein